MAKQTKSLRIGEDIVKADKKTAEALYRLKSKYGTSTRDLLDTLVFDIDTIRLLDQAYSKKINRKK